MTNEELGLTPDPESVESWKAYLADFRTFYWPLFKDEGFSFPEAFLVWKLNAVQNIVADLADDLIERKDF